jgi:hypothetical protein
MVDVSASADGRFKRFREQQGQSADVQFAIRGFVRVTVKNN